MTDEGKNVDEDGTLPDSEQPQSDSTHSDDSPPKTVPPLPTDPEEEKKGGCISPLGLLAIVAMLVVGAAILVPNFISARSRGQLTACKSNLKNIGTALEMYSTDWSGKYPSNISQLTPNYLKTIPECPAAGEVTYEYDSGQTAYNNPGFQDYYFVSCRGKNHTAVSVPEGYPQYDSISGLYER